MRNKWSFIFVVVILLMLLGCQSADGTVVKDYREIAFNALVENVTLNPDGDMPVPDVYKYQWSEEPGTDILYMGTMVNESEQLVCVQFYASDSNNAWRGIVIISAADGQVVDIHSGHIFTSGVIPAMTVGPYLGEKGDQFELNYFYEYGSLKKDYGTFEIILNANERSS